MRLALIATCCTAFAGSMLLPPLWGKAPADVAGVISVAEIVFEIEAKVAALDGLTASAEKYEPAQDKDVWQAFGVLSVMGQALAEHPQKDEAKFSGPALRDAAMKFNKGATLAEAQAALAAVKESRAGGGATDAATEHEWNKLLRMHPMMEEVNTRNAELVSVFRRPRGSPREVSHAVTIAVLSLAMYADTHEVKQPEEIPLWQEWATEYRTKMIGVAAALREKDGKTGRELFDQANETCDRCHEKFRDAE